MANRDNMKNDFERNIDYAQDKVGNKLDQAKGWMKEKWGWLTDDDFTEMEGRAEKIQAKVKDHYGDAKWESEYSRFTDEYPEYRDPNYRADFNDNLEHVGDKIGNKFDQAKGWMKEKWGWLTDDDYLEMEGNAEKIRAKVKDHYGDARWEEEYNRFADEYPEYRK